MIAIETKYIGPTNTRGSRIKASTSNGHTASVPYPYDLNDEKAHFEAVKALIAKHKLDWDISNMVYGGTKAGYVFCFANSKVQP